MKRKEKPKTLYVWLSVYYLVFFIGLIAYFILFRRMDNISLSIRDAMILRDLTLIVTLPQFAFLVLAFIRAVGFDIRKFNFSKDLKELDLKEGDNEEFEFVLGLDSYKYARYLRRKLREFKYYILENKFMFTILSGLTAGILIIVIILNFTVYNRTYFKNQKIHANNLTLQVNNSYFTDLDYTGNVIEKDKYFVVINTTFTNSSGLTTVLNLSSYQLKTKNGTVYPTLSRNNYFIDLGAGYAKEKIENDSSATYILVYELDKKQISNKYTLRIVDEINYKAGTINSKTKDVTIRPKSYDKINTVDTYKLGDTVTMYESILNNSTLTVNSFSFENKFTYKYEACIRSNCSDKTDIVTADATKSKTLLLLNGNLVIDENSTFSKNLKTTLSFFDAFVQLKYDNKVSTITNATPKSSVEQFVLQVDEDAKNATTLDLIVIVRNKKYVINLK